MQYRWNLFLIFFVFIFLTGCSPLPASPTPLIEQIIQPSKTPTPTPIWFPPTSTFTPFPSATPGLEATIQASLKLGQLILEDNFNQTDSWTYGKFGTGSILFGVNELSIGITQEGEYLSSLRSGTDISDYYLEITASPSICSGEDEFGVLFHVSPAYDYFRFGINCNGEARLDRFIDGIASVSHPLTRYGAIPVGAPISSQIGIQTAGKEISFFANGDYLFTIQDSTLTSGGIGVYARSASQNAITVNFSNLRIYKVLP
jgi:hypothetical protein